MFELTVWRPRYEQRKLTLDELSTVYDNVVGWSHPTFVRNADGGDTLVVAVGRATPMWR